MNSNKPLDILSKLVKDPSELSLGDMDKLVECSIDFFHEYMEIAQKGSPKEKDEALEKLLELKSALEKSAKETTQKTGVSTDEMIKTISDPSNFSGNDFETVQNIQSKITDFNTELLKMGSNSKPKRKARRPRRKAQLSI